jgi:hypothetical protein
MERCETPHVVQYVLGVVRCVGLRRALAQGQGDVSRLKCTMHEGYVDSNCGMAPDHGPVSHSDCDGE